MYPHVRRQPQDTRSTSAFDGYGIHAEVMLMNANACNDTCTTVQGMGSSAGCSNDATQSPSRLARTWSRRAFATTRLDRTGR